MANTIGIPEPGEYAGYFGRYVGMVPGGCEDIVEELARQGETTVERLGRLSEEEAGRSYAEGKWTVKELIGHIIDTERVMAYRALRLGRGDTTELPGFDQDVFAAGAPHAGRTLEALIDEYTVVRGATLCLLKGFDAAAWARMGVVSGNRLSVRALAFIICGHELAHWEILGTRYGIERE